MEMNPLLERSHVKFDIFLCPTSQEIQSKRKITTNILKKILDKKGYVYLMWYYLSYTEIYTTWMFFKNISFSKFVPSPLLYFFFF